MTSEFGPWRPLAIDDVTTLMSTTGIRWWFTGGHALEMALGRSWREHDDVDVGICRADVDGLSALLDDWEIHVAAAGVLQRWDGRALESDRHQNNLWFKRPDGSWCLDVCIGEGDVDSWVFRRDRTLRLPWNLALGTTVGGAAYLNPALQLLFKSATVRPKDDIDARRVIPELDDWGAALLDVRLRGEHPWRALIEARRRGCSAGDALEVLDILATGGVEAWVDGGWGIDALLGEQTRTHTDLDLALPARHWALAHDALAERSFGVVRRDGEHNVVLLDPAGRLIDLHAFDDSTTITGADGIEYCGPNGLAYEAGGFNGLGTIAGQTVPCMSASFQMRSHTGYDVDDDDWHDVRHLHDRFGLVIPADYDRWTAPPTTAS